MYRIKNVQHIGCVRKLAKQCLAHKNATYQKPANVGRDGIFDKISVGMKIRKMSQTCNIMAGSENVQNYQQRPKIAEMGSWMIFDER